MNLYHFCLGLHLRHDTCAELSRISVFVKLWTSEIWLFMAVWLGWNYTPLCWSQLLCHFLRGPRVILPRPGRFIEWLRCNSYMVEGPLAQITYGYYALKACPLQCNKRCYCTYEWLPSYCTFVFYILFLMLSNTCVHGLYWFRSNIQSICLLHPVFSLPITANTYLFH